MLGDKQQQTTESGSTAIQAGRDVNITGLSVSEVRELCSLYLRDNFPQLQAEARRAAEEQVRVFAAGLEARLAQDAASIAFEKFCDPDVQASINDAVQASARRGQAAHPEILSSLISERVTKKSSEYKDIVISEAIHVVPRLTGKQIALLAFVHSVRSMVYRGLTDIRGLEQIGRNGLLFSSPAFGLSESQKRHLEYAGAASVIDIYGGDIFEMQQGEYKHLGFKDGTALKTAIAANAPSYLRLLEQFATDNLFSVSLTSVGQAIALSHISTFIGPIDYGIWLN